MMDSERSEILDLVERAFNDLGGRATKAEVFLALTLPDHLPDHLRDYCERGGLNTIIESFFRKIGGNGLPQAPAVNSTGIHAQLELLTVDDCRYLVAAYRDRGDANYRRASQIVEYCDARFAVVIDIDNPLDEEAAS